MSGDNPYAPPQVDETEAPLLRHWRVEGTSVLVKNLAALPMVDLNTGDHDVPLKCVRRMVQQNNLSQSIRTVAVIFAFTIIGSKFFDDRFYAFLLMFVVLLLLRLFDSIRASSTSSLMVMEYLGKKSLRQRTRVRWRVILSIVLLVFYLFGLSSWETSMPVFITAAICILATAAWGIVDRPSARATAGPAGWMKFQPVHPDALVYLTRLEQESASAAGDGFPSRKVRTIHFRKFPLSVLLGRRRNPLVVINMALAKLLRSRHLVREAYHFSEAQPVELAELCEPVRQEIMAWTAAHPGWTFRSGERLPSPDGAMIVENAHVASATHEQELWIAATWHVSAPGQRNIHHTFITWLENGGRVCTHDHAFIPLDIPGVYPFRASGDLEQVHHEHLRNYEGRAVEPPADEEGRAARFAAMQEEADRRLTALGYQSELR